MIYKVRRMSDSDIDAVYAIESGAHITPWSKDILRNCVGIGYDCQVLEMQTDFARSIVGYIISRHSNNQCHILNFCIEKSRQLQGLGRSFLNTYLTSLNKFNEIHSIVLEVRPSNKVALHLYEVMGFIQTEYKQDYYKDANGTEDAIYLEKKVH